MSRKSKQSPVEQRRSQIEKELEKLRLPKNKKTARDFKSQEGFENWQTRYERKFFELNEEAVILENPLDYDEIPLAIAATELGVTLDEMLSIVSEDLIETSYNGEYRTGARITRAELARVIEIGANELVRVAEQSIDEIFDEAVKALHNGDIEAAEKAYERIEKFGYEANYHYSISCGIALELLRGDYRALRHSFWFVDSYEDIQLASVLDALRRAVEGIKPADHLAAVVREQILAVAEGKKETPFDRTYSSYENTEYFSQMNENQRHSMMLSSVVLRSIEKYHLQKRMSRYSWHSSEPKNEELERVIRNAIFTALEAESTYHESPSSKLFIDKFAELFPKRWTPAEHIKLLPENKFNK